MSCESFGIKPLVAMLCVALVASPLSYGQQAPAPDNATPPTPQLESDHPHWYSGFTHPYESRVVPPISISNSTRLDSLLRAGKIYLSLSDTIALSIENNLDVEVERYIFPLAEADLLRAKSGAATQGISTTVLPGIPNSPGQTVLGSTNAGLSAPGYTSPLGNGFSYDPFINSAINWGHATQPESNTVVSGTSALVTTAKTANFSIGQTFLTGGTATLSYNNLNQFQNSFRSTINPNTASNLDLTVTQPFLQGFGLALNNRNIRIAKNNVKAADLVFKQQLINTVANVVSLYWNLVAANLNVDVKNQAVAVSQKLYEDNQKQVEVGTLAPIEVVRAEAQLASDQQALVQAQSVVFQLETILKSALSRNGLTSETITEARVVATDPIRIPDVEPVEPIQDLVSRALDNRPDLSQSRVQIDNSKIALDGTKNALLPSLNFVGDVRNNALAGPQNTVRGPISTQTGLIQNPSIADPFFVGGYSDILGQLFGRNFPTYTVGVNLIIPLRNRAAQANLATATLNLRQNELQVQRQINQIRVDVQNALIGLLQARAQYQAAMKQRTLEEQTVDADQKKLALGATTIFQVIQDQRDLATAGQNLVQAEATYIQARVQLDIATGAILQNNNVEFDDAKSGHISKPPSPLPPLDQNGQGVKNSPANAPAASR